MNGVAWKTAGAFALIGFLLSTRKYILFMNGLNPVAGLIVYYAQIFLTLEALQWFGLVVGGVRQNTLWHTLGEMMIIFAFFIIVDLESKWVQVVVGEDTQQAQNCPGVYIQAEDGAVFYLWNHTLGLSNEASRWLTFVATPAVLAYAGMLLTSGRPIQRALLA